MVCPRPYIMHALVCAAVAVQGLRLRRSSATARSEFFDDPATQPDAAVPAPQDATVLYGIMTNNRPEYQAKLQAQLDTWAADALASKRFVAVTGIGSDLPTDMDQKGIYMSTCDDRYKGVTCKEERLMEIGFAKGADWLVILGEDNYVDTKGLENRLAFAKSDEPTVLGLVGDRTDTQFCPEMSQQLFGGGGYALNKAALHKLLNSGQEELRSEYASGSGLQGDTVTSCALTRRGISFADLPGMVGARIMTEKSLLALTKKGPFTYHYLTPDAMRWLHATLQQRSEDEVHGLEQRAFVNGCCCASTAKEQKACEAAVQAAA
eukprot:TRINITY_DN103041_c0_g1_i1.p2 TRINITY_DN103041_c0_g1~~TRINITY_DN103041_c0_g1_i1.p2  ORF type:complete len:321 (+),score=92.61 TRINITY_DN103041_c0_g1_i1:89-1051(+)